MQSCLCRYRRAERGHPTNHHTEKLTGGIYDFFFLLVHHLKGLFYFTKVFADTPEFANTYLLN